MEGTRCVLRVASQTLDMKFADNDDGRDDFAALRLVALKLRLARSEWQIVGSGAGRRGLTFSLDLGHYLGNVGCCPSDQSNWALDRGGATFAKF